MRINWSASASAGSEAMEAALKLARQYYVEIGQPQRPKFIARRNSYHGNTLGALAVGGNAWRRRQFAPLLIHARHVAPCYAYRDQRADETAEAYGARLATELEATIAACGEKRVIAFVAETVGVATSGALMPVPGARLPQVETLCRYVTGRNPESGRQEYSFHAQLPGKVPTVYFGVRSCDLFAVLYSDMVFRQAKDRDIYFDRRRADAVFISIGCARPFASCFRNATRNGPFLDAGFDLQLTDLGDRWFVQIGRPRGVRLIEEWPAFFTLATEADKKAQFQVELEARGLFARHVHVDLAIKLLREAPEPAAVFAELSRRCQDCGGCAYICPTCTCFTITDLRQDSEIGERRPWPPEHRWGHIRISDP